MDIVSVSFERVYAVFLELLRKLLKPDYLKLSLVLGKPLFKVV